MSVTWGQLFGETATFGVRLELSDDPDRGLGATSVEAASWGSIELHLRDKNVCAHYDGEALARAVHWYLWPLAAWVRARWTPLLHEEHLVVPAEDALESVRLVRSDVELDALSEWWQRHHLWAASDGGLFPELTIRRLGDDIEFTWGDGASQPGRPDDYRFVESGGRELVDVSVVAGVLTAAFSALTSELARRVEIDEVHALRDAWRDLPRQDLRRDAVAWSVGEEFEKPELVLDLASALPPDRAFIIRRRPPVLALFASASPTLEPGDVEMMLASFGSLDGAESRELAEISRRHTQPDDLSWRSTRELAANVADRHTSFAGPPFDIDGLVASLGVRTTEVTLADRGIGAATLSDGVHSPIVAINTSYRGYSPLTRRFNIAHELGHLLMDRGEARELGITSGPWAPAHVERRARVFAAALLIGQVSLAEAVGGEPALDADAVTRLAERFAVPWTAMLGQLRWDRHLTWAEHDALREDWTSSEAIR